MAQKILYNTLRIFLTQEENVIVFLSGRCMIHRAEIQYTCVPSLGAIAPDEGEVILGAVPEG